MGGNALVNIGEQWFDRLIELDKFYIDKTGFIKEWWETGATAILITRPRRFGKTLNMSMIECFFRINMQTGVIYLRGCPFGVKKNTGNFKAHIR